MHLKRSVIQIYGLMVCIYGIMVFVYGLTVWICPEGPNSANPKKHEAFFWLEQRLSQLRFAGIYTLQRVQKWGPFLF